jgi:hypothetical protein
LLFGEEVRRRREEEKKEEEAEEEDEGVFKANALNEEGQDGGRGGTFGIERSQHLACPSRRQCHRIASQRPTRLLDLLG